LEARTISQFFGKSIEDIFFADGVKWRFTLIHYNVAVYKNIPEIFDGKWKFYKEVKKVSSKSDELTKVENEIRYLEDMPKIDSRTEQYLFELYRKREILKAGR
jgi:hypothetical protein